MSPGSSSSFEETAAFALAALLLALVVLRVFPLGPGIALGLVAVGRGLQLTIRRRRALTRQRELADAVLVSLAGEAVPEGLRWRADELGSVDHRRLIARQLHRFARMGGEKVLITSVPVYLDTLWPNADELDEIAEVVERIDRPLPPRGLVLLEDLLSNGDESPLYRPASADELGEALHHVHEALERRAA